MLAGASDLFGFIADHAGSRTALRGALATFAADKAVGALRANGIYPGLPKEARQWARARVREIVAALLDNDLFDPVLDALASLSGESADFLDDVREIAPGDDVAAALATLFLDRFEDAIRDEFGHADPGWTVSFTVPFVNVHLSFGVHLPLRGIVSALRDAVRGMRRFNTEVGKLSAALIALIAKENDLVAAEDEHAALDAHRQRTDRHLAEAREPTPGLTILSPQPGAALDGVVVLTMRAEGVTQAYLGVEDGEQQRLFVWINQRALPVDSFTVTTTPPLTIRRDVLSGAALATRAVASHPLMGRRAAAQDDDRMARSAKLAQKRGAGRGTAIEAGLLGRTGRVQRVGGKALAATPAKGELLPGRKFDPRRGAPVATSTRATLTLTATIPPDLLHEGINTIACAIVPGAADRRIEHVVSFLVTAPQPPARRTAIIMPGRPVWKMDVLHADVRKSLAQQFGVHRVALEHAGPSELHVLAKQMWFPAKAARQAVVKQTATEIKAVLPLEAARTAVIRNTLERRGFRPVMQQPAERRARPIDASQPKERK